MPSKPFSSYCCTGVRSVERNSAGETTWSATRTFTLERNHFLAKFVEKGFGDAVIYKTTGIFVKCIFPKDQELYTSEY